MDFDDPYMTDPRVDESAEEFASRVRMLSRMRPLLQALKDRQFVLVVESDRRNRSSSGLISDLVVEYGETRLRMILRPGEQAGTFAKKNRERLASYFQDTPDTDAVAIVGDDDDLSTVVLDIYDVNLDRVPAHPRMRLADALFRYFDANVFAVEMPDFRRLVSLPTDKELAGILNEAISKSFDAYKSSRPRVREKVVALEMLGDNDRNIIAAGLQELLHGRRVEVQKLLGDEGRIDD